MVEVTQTMFRRILIYALGAVFLTAGGVRAQQPEVEARIAGLEGNAEYMSLLREDAQLQIREDSIVNAVERMRRQLREDPGKRRVLQGYFVICIALLFLMLFFNAIFLLMAISINRNVRLQQENQLLSMQQQRYESLKAAIEETRQARHDLRHQLCQLAALAEEGNLEKIKAYLSGAVSRIPSLEMHFCENRAADSVVGYYCALAKRENIPYSVQIDLPECLPVDEINLCLVLSNLLENALEASLRTAPARRRIKLTAYLHGNSLALIQVENTYDGVIREKGGVFQSSKRKGDGVGLQSVRHIAEKSGGVSTVTYQDGLFCAKVMLCG